MSRRFRLGLFTVAVTVLAAVLVHGLAGLPAFGHYHGVYGILLDRVAVPERHATDLVSAVNFDYRGLDTMGEEFILFGASIGLVVLLREQRDERVDHERAQEEGDPEQLGNESGERERHRGKGDARPRSRTRRRHPDTSPVLPATGRWLVGPVLVLGVYVVTHGQLTPGGGFQGGVVLAAGMILVFAAGARVAMAPLGSSAMAEVSEALGAGGYVAIGVAGLLAGASFLSNFLPHGTIGSLLSGGTIAALSTIVGLEVVGALTVIVSEFADQRLLVDKRSRSKRRRHR
jgi:multicomponent Na+:H+ antiporter subunit B